MQETQAEGRRTPPRAPPRASPRAPFGLDWWWPVAFVVLVGGPLVAAAPAVQAVGYPLLAAVALIGAAAGIRRHRPAYGHIWWVLLAGGYVAVAGAVFEHVHALATPEAAWLLPASQASYAAAYVLAVFAYVSVIRLQSGHRDWVSLLDGSILAIGAAVLGVGIVLVPATGVLDPTDPALIAAVAYPVLDLYVLLLFLRLLLLPGTRNVSLRLLLAGLAVVLVADVLTFGAVGGYRVSGSSTLWYTIGIALAAAAARHPSMRELTARRRRARDGAAGTARLVVLTIAAFAGPAVFFVDYYRPGAVHAPADSLLIVSAVLFGLFIARLYIALRDMDRARAMAARTASRQRAVAEAAAALDTAVAEDAILSVTTDAARAILGHPVSLLRSAPGGRSIPIKAGGSVAAFLPLPVTDADAERTLSAVAAAAGLRLEALHATEALAGSERRFRALVQHATDGIVILDREGNIRFATPSAARLLGRAPADLIGANGFRLATAENPQMGGALSAVLAGEQRLAEHVLVHAELPDGDLRSFEVTATDLTDEPAVGGVVVNFHDVTAQKRLEEELREQALFDPLTGVANRVLFLEELRRIVARRAPGNAAVLMLDLDDFKTVNDTMGHEAGDTLLRAVGARLRSSLRAGDLPCRLGGDEFAVLLADLSTRDDAEASAIRLLNALNVPVTVGSRAVSPAASIGIVLVDEVEPDVSAVMSAADLALYEAKAAGKNGWCHYAPRLREAARARLELRQDLERALRRDELVVHYQPVIDLRSERVVGAEALVRWQRPDGRLLLPGDFLPAIGKGPAIVALGWRVLEQVCDQLVIWDEGGMPALSVGVNVSVQQLEEPTFVDGLLLLLDGKGLSPERLVLELHETDALRAMECCPEQASALRAAGVRLAIDDFGKGYGALAQLQQIELDVLKIDRSCLRDATAGGQGAALPRAIVSLARTLGMVVVGEGVESPEEAARWLDAGCRLGQGFLYAAPAPPDRFTADLDWAVSGPGWRAVTDAAPV